RIPVGFLPCITKGMQGEHLTEMAELRDLGALGFTDDGKPVRSAGMMRLALQYQQMVGGVLALHEEDPALSGSGAMHEGDVSALLGITGIPSISESTMVARDAALAGYEGGRIHVQHLSAVESVEAVADAKGRGVQITAEASPHHLTLTDEAIRASLDTRLKMNPPLRAEADRAAVRQGVRDGTLDVIATDHAPHHYDEKEQAFDDAPNGIVGLETALGLSLTELVHTGLLDLATLVDRMSCSPARAFSLAGGTLRVGAPADVTLFDPSHEWTVDSASFLSLSRNTPFEGRSLRGRAVRTVVGGRTVWTLETRS
ncbi:MAG: dihydroorotase, partial [Gemmatimonadetes bacterium]|nr:dihydroorotase [Gemmatimonadota bacterium]